MMISYETDYRPNYELMLALAWGGSGLCCALMMIFYSGFPWPTTLVLTSVFFVMAFYQATFAKARYTRMQRLERAEQNFFTLDELHEKMRDGALFLGRGFDWSAIHTQKVSDLYRDPERLAEIKRNRKGGTFLQGVGIDDEEEVFVLDNESKGHVHIVGTTGSGKTRLLDLLVTQAILRGEPVIMIDPKGDHELKNNMEAAYRRLNRSRDFIFFHPAFVDESAAINPLASYRRSSELASRLAAIIPSSKSGGDAFSAFSENALLSIFYAVEMAGLRPTIMDVQRALSEGFGPLCERALRGWAYSIGPEMDMKMTKAMSAKTTASAEERAVFGIQFYQEASRNDPSLSSAEMNNLATLLLHDKVHFQKMVSSLVPVVGKLCSGPLATLFSPDPSANRMPKSGRVISLKHVIDTAGGCYIGLDTLSDPTIGRAMGQMILADLAAQAGERYNFAREKGKFINIFVDEASEVTNEQLIQLLNKGRGAGMRLFVATQTLADYEARMESAAVATQLIANMNNTIMLRTLDPDTQEKLAARLPEVPISYIMKTTASSMGDTSHTGAFAINHGERLMSEDKPLVAPQSFGDLSDLEYFALLAKGNLIKGRLPILDPPKEDYQEARPEHYAAQTKGQIYQFDDEVDLETIEERLPQHKVEQPPVVEFTDDDYQHLMPVPPYRRRLYPPFCWIDVFPGFRKADHVPPTPPDPFVAAAKLEEAGPRRRPEASKSDDPWLSDPGLSLVPRGDMGKT